MPHDDSRTVQPAGTVNGSLRMPGDKSISHRAAMLAALATGESTIEGFLTSEDCLNTLGAVQALGAGVARNGTTITVTGTGGVFTKPADVLDMGNSGTSIRLMAGLLAGQPFDSEMTGDASLRSRPMKRIQAPLELMGARVELTGPTGCAPVKIRGGRLHGIEYRLPVASAQVKSCVLLAGLFAEGTTVVVEPEPTRNHTETMFRAAGIPVVVEGERIGVHGGAGRTCVKPRRWTVPGDLSSAAFWLGAAACREGSRITIENIGLNPRRTAFLDVLRRMGADVEIAGQQGEDWEPAGTVTIRGTRLRGAEVGGMEIPNLIDELPMVAVLGAMAEGTTTIRDAKELRVKESDRITTVVQMLRTFGGDVDETPDGMVVRGGRRLRGGGTLDSKGDHRIAMCATILALFADAPVKVNGVACIATSYPTFWEHAKEVTAS